MIKIAVTGASGFVGQHVLVALQNPNVDIIAHSRVPRSDHSKSDGLSWTYFDFADQPANAFERLGKPDVVIHLGWNGLPNYLSSSHLDIELPLQTDFLEALVTSGLKKLVVSGTCFEYGMQTGKLSEAMPTAPQNPYAIAKDTLRQRLQRLAQLIPFNLTWLRLFYLYGQGQGSKSLYSLFCQAVERNDMSFDMSPGDQLRDFMRIEDAAACIVRLALLKTTPDVINVCSGLPTSVLGLVEKWRQELGTDIELNIGVFPYPTYEPMAFWGNNERLSNLLG